MAAKKAVSPSQTLPSKEANQFKTILKQYEQKQYKKALKLAEGILKKFPENGETLCVKGLVISQMDRKEEAYELVKKGLSLNDKSYICWHVSGLLHRGDQKYTDAIKCYQNALKYDKDNGQILREVCVLQIQTRDLKGYQKTRKKMVQKQPNNRANWIGFSMAHHMGGNYKVSLAIWDLYYSTLSKKRERPSYEESEMLMYKAMILEDSGKLQECYDFLGDSEKDIVDVISFAEKRAWILLRLSKFDEAKAAFEKMLVDAPENYEYHRGYQASILGLNDVSDLRACELPVVFLKPTESQLTELKSFYDKMSAQNPKIWSYQRIPLDFLSGDDFRSRLELFFKKGIRKGVTSIFSCFKPLYKTALNTTSDDEEKERRTVSSDVVKDAKERIATIGAVIESFLNSLRSTSHFPGENGEKEDPTVYLWTLVIHAQHLDMMGKTEEALKAINEAVEHTPTAVDVLKVKSQILKRAGDLQGCVDAVETGRLLDLADRYINTKATKYLLRANNIKEAEQVVSLFTKHEGDSQANLFEMQCMWYEIEAGNAFLRLGDITRSLKYFISVDKHFDVIIEDQYDFHSYCLRKVTLRPYIALLHLEDMIRGHKYYRTAIHGAIVCYLQVHDMPALFKVKKDDEVDYSTMTAAEKKKAKQRARKAQLKKQKEAEEKAKKEAEKRAEQAQNSKKSSRTRKLPVDKDPTGEIAFNKIRDRPLEAAWELLKKIRPNTMNKLQTHLDSFDVAVRMKKYALGISALRGASSCVRSGVEHPEIHWRLVAFMQVIEKQTIVYAPWASKSTNKEDAHSFVNEALEVPEIVLNAVKKIGGELLNNKTPSEVSKAYCAKVSGSDQSARKLASVKGQLLVIGSSQDKLISDLVEGEAKNEGMLLESAKALLEFSRNFCSDKAIVEQCLIMCRQKFPLASVFASS